MLYSNLGNKNSVAGHIKCSHGLQVPHPYSSITTSDILSFVMSTFLSMALKLGEKTSGCDCMDKTVNMAGRYLVVVAKIKEVTHKNRHVGYSLHNSKRNIYLQKLVP